jgi:hypothetical protein
MSDRHNQQVRLDELAAGKLPERIIAAISEMELTVAEVTQWEAGKPTVHFVATEGELTIEIRVHIPTKKLLAILGGVSSLLWATTNLILRYLPALQTFLQGGQPGP